MKHPFLKSVLDASICVICKRVSEMHGSSATCEACSNVGNVELKNGIALCESCFNSESVVKQAEPTLQIKPIKTDQLEAVELLRDEICHSPVPSNMQNKCIEKMGQPAIQISTDFFNARTQSLAELENEIMKDDSIPSDKKYYELTSRVREHFLHLKQTLFKTVDLQLMIASEQRADQTYWNSLAARLSAEEREKLKVEYIDYVPKAPPKVVAKAPTLSKSDKLIASIAKTLNIPFEQAKRQVESGLRGAGIECTCNETPGMCKMHVK